MNRGVAGGYLFLLFDLNPSKMDKTKSQALVKQAGVQFSSAFKNYLTSDSIIHHLGEKASISIGSVEILHNSSVGSA